MEKENVSIKSEINTPVKLALYDGLVLKLRNQQNE